MRKHDLIVIGAGSGNMVVDDRAGTLIQIFVVAMNFGVSAADLAHQPYWIHPAPTEVVENALPNLRRPAS